MAWKGIPKLMHKRNYNMSYSTTESTYYCGEIFRSWSSTWMDARSDTTTVDGETVFRFTSGTQVIHLPICPNCYGDTAIEIPQIEFDEDFDEVYHVEPDDASVEVLISNDDPIYLWASLAF